MDPMFLFCSDNCDDLVTVEILIDSIVSYRENHIPVMKRKVLIENWMERRYHFFAYNFVNVCFSSNR